MKLGRIFDYIKALFIYKMTFSNFGLSSVIYKPLKIEGRKNIEIDKKVFIAYKTWLAALPLTGENNCLLQINEGCRIGNFNHIFATKKIILEKNVLTADRVYISDNFHCYEDVRRPILMQPIIQNKEVIIGEGSWLGENVCVLGAIIGKNCVIGANAVVTKDIPDFSVAVGIPARIIKRYCHNKNQWLDTDKEGNFL